jgi:hypothetical protein
MPLVSELSAGYGNFMLGPRHGRDICARCFNITDGYERCYACAHGGRALDVMVPISYSVAGEQLHHALAGYKRLSGVVARRLTMGLAAVLWRHLASHEACMARAVGIDQFGVVTSVPSSGEGHALQDLVSMLVGPVRDRYVPLLTRSDKAVMPHRFDGGRYTALQSLKGEAVLLIDDMWTTGANAQSAATALKAAGAGRVGAVVIGRHVNRDWGRCDRTLRDLPQPFDWERCALCDSAQALSAA